MTDNQIIAHSPFSGWQVPDSFKSVRYYVTRASDFPALVAIRQWCWAMDPAPSVTAIVVSGLARAEYLIEIEAVAIAQ